MLLFLSVCNDALTFKMKGRTVMNETERYEAVRHCRYVDELISDAPWQLDEEFLEKYKVSAIIVIVIHCYCYSLLLLFIQTDQKIE